MIAVSSTFVGFCLLPALPPSFLAPDLLASDVVAGAESIELEVELFNLANKVDLFPPTVSPLPRRIDLS